jgi:vacuolar protein-sorting-associated protein 4
MFELHTGSTPCKMNQRDFKGLGELTEGCVKVMPPLVNAVLLILLCRFSGSDIAVVVRDALMEPVRKVQMATHFRRVSCVASGY